MSASASSSALASLRQLLSERFPQAARAPSSALPTEIASLDDATHGGLPRHALTELVCSAPSCGGELLLGQLLHAVRNGAGRAALIDATDSFDPSSWPADDLRCLVWLRCRKIADAMAVADLCARDANLVLVLLDLRRAAAGELRRIPARTWYRLQRAIEQTDAAFVALTSTATVPSAQLRLTLDRSLTFTALLTARPLLAAALTTTVQRQRTASIEATG